MLNVTAIIGVILTCSMFGFLILDKKRNKETSNLSKDDKELIILDKIMYRVKLKDNGTNIDKVFKNLRKNKIDVDFKLDFNGEKR